MPEISDANVEFLCEELVHAQNWINCARTAAGITPENDGPNVGNMCREAVGLLEMIADKLRNL